MKSIIKFIIFLIITLAIFFIDNVIILVGLLLINGIIAMILKIDLKRMYYNLRLLLPFIILTVAINIFVDSLYNAIVIGVRIVICYNITYIFSKIFTTLELGYTIEKICCPLKIFKINTKNIGMIVSISICMIPVLRYEIKSIIQSMKAKGKVMKINSIKIMMKPLLISVLKRTAQIEKVLIAKAYVEE